MFITHIQPSKAQCIEQAADTTAVSLGIAGVVAGILLVLAAYQMLPQGVNAISQLGIYGKIIGFGTGGLGFLIGSVAIALIALKKTEPLETPEEKPITPPPPQPVTTAAPPISDEGERPPLETPEATPILPPPPESVTAAPPTSDEGERPPLETPEATPILPPLPESVTAAPPTSDAKEAEPIVIGTHRTSRRPLSTSDHLSPPMQSLVKRSPSLPLFPLDVPEFTLSSPESAATLSATVQSPTYLESLPALASRRQPQGRGMLPSLPSNFPQGNVHSLPSYRNSRSPSAPTGPLRAVVTDTGQIGAILRNIGQRAVVTDPPRKDPLSEDALGNLRKVISMDFTDLLHLSKGRVSSRIVPQTRSPRSNPTSTSTELPASEPSLKPDDSLQRSPSAPGLPGRVALLQPRIRRMASVTTSDAGSTASDTSAPRRSESGTPRRERPKKGPLSASSEIGSDPSSESGDRAQRSTSTPKVRGKVPIEVRKYRIHRDVRKIVATVSHLSSSEAGTTDSELSEPSRSEPDVTEEELEKLWKLKIEAVKLPDGDLFDEKGSGLILPRKKKKLQITPDSPVFPDKYSSLLRVFFSKKPVSAAETVEQMNKRTRLHKRTHTSAAPEVQVAPSKEVAYGFRSEETKANPRSLPYTFKLPRWVIRWSNIKQMDRFEASGDFSKPTIKTVRLKNRDLWKFFKEKIESPDGDLMDPVYGSDLHMPILDLRIPGIARPDQAHGKIQIVFKEEPESEFTGEYSDSEESVEESEES